MYNCNYVYVYLLKQIIMIIARAQIATELINIAITGFWETDQVVMFQ